MDHDLEEWSALWQSREPTPTLPTRALTRARLIERAEFVLGGVLLLQIIFGAWSSGTFRSILFGTALILILLWTGRSRYRLRRTEWSAGESSESFIDAELTRLRARQRRTFWSLVLMPPATVIALLFAGGPDGDLWARATGLFSWSPSRLGALFSILAMVVWLAVLLRRQNAQLRRLAEMREEYRAGVF